MVTTVGTGRPGFAALPDDHRPGGQYRGSFRRAIATRRPVASCLQTGFFFDTIERQDPDFDEDNLVLEDNLEEFGLMTDEEEAYWKSTGRAMRVDPSEPFPST